MRAASQTQLSQRRPTTTTAASRTQALHHGLGTSIELLWLAAVVLVPLTFGPPDWSAFFDIPKVALMRTLAALILGAWTLEAALRVPVPRERLVSTDWPRHAIRWLNDYPPRWTIAAAAVLGVAALLSSVASAIPSTALWGYEQGRDGGSLLSIASVLTVFFAIALRLRSEQQAWRLVAAIAAGTTIASGYVLVQALGLDPFDLRRFLPGRVVGTFGNPIFAGAALLQGLPLVLAGAVVAGARWRPRASLAVGAVAAGVTIAAIVLTLARGPWVGAAVAASSFLALGWRVLPRERRRWLLALAGAAAALALLLLAAIDGSLGRALDRAGSIPAAAAGGLGGRDRIWDASLRLVATRPWFDFEAGAPIATRHLLGYGPDSFLYVYPLRERPVPDEAIRQTKAAHNQHVHAAVEQGVLGLLAALSVTFVPLIAGGYVLVRRSASYPWAHRLLLAALLSSVAGRAVEQLVGVAQLSDTLLHWAVLGLLVALPRTMGPAAAGRDERAAAPARLRLAWVPVVAIVAALLVTVTIGHAVDPVLASRQAALAARAGAQGDRVAELERVVRAVERAPAVVAYRLRAVAIFDETRGSGIPRENQAGLLELAVSVLEEGLEYQRLSLELNARLAVEHSQLVQHGTESAQSAALAAFERTAALQPNRWPLKRNLGVALLEAGRPADAVPPLSEAVTILGDAGPAAEVLLLQGIALRDAGRTHEAKASLEDALRRAPGGALESRIRTLLDGLAAATAGSGG